METNSVEQMTKSGLQKCDTKILVEARMTPVVDHAKPYRRKAWGRAARSRRKKKMEIMRHVGNVVQGKGVETHDPKIVSVTSNTVIPIDRNRIWPSVLERRSQMWRQSDETALKCQLGYVPGNAISVASRVCNISSLYPELHRLLLSENMISNDKINDKNSAPLVVQLYPLAVRDEQPKGSAPKIPNCVQTQEESILDNNTISEQLHLMQQSIEQDIPTNLKSLKHPDPLVDATSDLPIALEPFPTIYWLTHPALRTMISGLEVEGYGVKYAERIGEDTLLVEKIRVAHRKYGIERYQLLTDSDRSLIDERKWQEVFCSERRGIAGIRYTQQCSRKKKNVIGNSGETWLPPVKCLHTHAAHYLSGCTDNFIGQWVMEQIEENIQSKKTLWDIEQTSA